MDNLLNNNISVLPIKKDPLLINEMKKNDNLGDINNPSIISNNTNIFDNLPTNGIDNDLTSKNTNVETLEKAKMSSKAGLSTSLMESISAKLQMCDKGDASVLSWFDRFTMIGTTRGCIFVFDRNQELVNILTPPDIDPVTSLAYCDAYELLVSSNRRGKITIWDMAKGKVVKEIGDIHSFSITSLSFVSQNPMLLLSVDIGGVTYLTEIQKRMWIISVNPQKFPTIAEGIGLCSTFIINNDNTLVAQSSLSNTIIYKSNSVTRRGKVALWPKPDDISPTAIPCMAWSLGIIQGTRDPVPLLARGWDKHLEFYCADGPYDRWLSIFDQKTDAPVLCLSWLESQKTVFLDQEGQLSIFDLSFLNIIETVDLTAINPISIPVSNQTLYGSTPVSYHLSFYGREGKVYMLEPKILYCGSIKTVYERVEEQINDGNYVNGLAIYSTYYETTIRDEYSTQAKLLQQKILNLLKEYIECAFGKGPKHIEDNLENVVSTSYKICESLNRVDELYNTIFPIFLNTNQFNTFFNHLINGLKSQTITNLPIEMFNQFIQYMLHMDKQTELENTIIKMDLSKVNIQEFISVCSSHHLYHSVLYIFNRHLKKYFSPIILLFNNYEVTNRKDIGDILMNYLKLLFEGKCYPDGNIDKQIVPAIISEVCGFICNKRIVENSNYPALHILLKLSIDDTLNLLSVPFNNPNTYSSIFEYPNHVALKFICPTEQEIFESLCSEILDKQDESLENKSKVINFLGLSVASGEINIPKSYYTLILECLFYNVDTYPKDIIQERQNILLTLIRQLNIEDYDIEHIIEVANNSILSPVTALLHRKTGDITQGLLSYINNKDEEMRKQVFAFILGEVNESNEQFRDKMLGILKKYINNLIEIDMYKSTLLLLQLLPNEIDNILDNLDGEKQCNFLEYLVGEGNNADEKMRLSNLKESTHYKISDELEYNYLTLLCKYNQEKIEPYLRNHYTYDIDKVLELCKEYQLKKCVIFLMVKKELYLEAYELLKQDIIIELDEFSKEMCDNCDINNCKHIEKLKLSIDDGVDLLCHYSLKSKDTECWYGLLTLINDNRKNMMDKIQNNEYNTVIINLIGKILSEMKKYIPIKDIMEYILQTHGKDELGPFRFIISEIMLGNTTDIRIVQTAKKITEKDAFKTSSNIFHEIMPFTPQSTYCSICEKKIDNDSISDIIVFNCGHICHSNCTIVNCCTLCCKASESDNYHPFSTISASHRESEVNIEYNVNKIQIPRCYMTVNLDYEYDRLENEDYDLDEDNDFFECTPPLLPFEEKRRLIQMVQQITQPLNQEIIFTDNQL